jgi:bifunctional NMN adenylyltransferase/nudix hydrolase
MLKAKVGDDAMILPILDCASDEEWSANVDQLIKMTFPTQHIVMYGGRDSFILHYTGRNVCKKLDFPSEDTTSATEIRELLAEKPANSADARAGSIYTISNLYPRIHPTVDIALVNFAVEGGSNPKNMVLLGRKPSETKLRFPGGFVDPADANYEDAARRELKEETDMAPGDKAYCMGSFEIDDWRYRDIPNQRIVTTFWFMYHSWGAPKAGDDLEEVRWCAIDDPGLTCKIVDCHVVLLDRLRDSLQFFRDMLPSKAPTEKGKE